MRWARLAYIGFNRDIEAFGDPNANRNFADYWLGCALRFAGAFQLKAGVNVLYSSLSTVALGVASASQSLALLAAMYFVDKTVSSRRAELEQVPDDEEVKIADERSATRKRIIREATKWEVLLQLWSFC